MNLAKWLIINKSIKQIGGQHGRFVLPVSTAEEGSDMKSVLYPRLIERNLSSQIKEYQSEEITNNAYSRDNLDLTNRQDEQFNITQPHPTAAQTENTVQQSKIYVSDNIQKTLFDSPSKPAKEKQLTLDDWKSKEKNNADNPDNASIQSFSRVGRWALKRGFQKVPKPPPIQTEFQLKSIQVVKNDLNYSDIEIVARPVKGKFSRFIANLCSLTSQSVVRLIKKIRLITD